MKWKVRFERYREVQRHSGHTEVIEVTIDVPSDFKPTGLSQVMEPK